MSDFVTLVVVGIIIVTFGLSTILGKWSAGALVGLVVAIWILTLALLEVW